MLPSWDRESIQLDDHIHPLSLLWSITVSGVRLTLPNANDKISVKIGDNRQVYLVYLDTFIPFRF